MLCIDKILYDVYRLFRQKPEIMIYFEHIIKDTRLDATTDSQIDVLKLNRALQEHASKVLHAIDMLICYIDDPLLLERLVANPAHRHLKLRSFGFTGKQFQVYGLAMHNIYIYIYIA